MPCTYCGSRKHTRGKCDKIEKDYETYEKVSVLSRKKLIETLTEKGILPGATVRTYNRTENFMNKFSNSEVVSLGPVDVFSHYTKTGRSPRSTYIEAERTIALSDDNEDLVSVKNCYEIVQASPEEWETESAWVNTQLLAFAEFKAMFKGKKRHPAFTGELYTCIVKEMTTKEETFEELVARVSADTEEEDSSEGLGGELEESSPVYVVTSIATSDDYKRPYTSTETKTALTQEDAAAVAAYMYLERVQEYGLLDSDEVTLKELKSITSGADLLVPDKVCDFFETNDRLFQGEYVPLTFSISVESRTSTTIGVEAIKSMLNEM